MGTSEMLKPSPEAQATRQEKDSLGYKDVPADVYYGIQTLRGLENFPISGLSVSRLMPEQIRAFGWIKKAAAQTNMDLGLLDKKDAATRAAPAPPTT
jgi:aspartate ammonia-lyase